MLVLKSPPNGGAYGGINGRSHLYSAHVVQLSSKPTSTHAHTLILAGLPNPHRRIIITCPSLDDANDILPILNDNRVYPWMGAGLPYPHEHKHALAWLQSVKPNCDFGQEDLHLATANKSTPSTRECPVRIIRESAGDKEVFVGDCGIGRWSFPDVVDKQQREQLKSENKAKATGDPTIIWSIGYYLHPDYHGKGIMKNVIHSLMSWATANMNVRHIRTTAMKDNEPSVRVLKKNGFIVEKTLPDFGLKAGLKVGLHVLDWKAPCW